MESVEADVLYCCSLFIDSLKPRPDALPSSSFDRIPPGKKGVDVGFKAGLLDIVSMAIINDLASRDK